MNNTTFYSNHSNYINITFGIQATDNGEGATRCFNWVSVGSVSYTHLKLLQKKFSKKF